MKGISIDKKLLVGIIFLGLSLRLGWVIHLKDAGLMFADAGAYDQIGASLASGKGYSDSEGNPTAQRSPCYPLFIGVIYWLFGEHNLFAVRIFQAILGTITLIFLFLLGKRVFNWQVGIIASFLASCNPYLIYYNGAILQETIFIFFVTLMLYFLVKTNFFWAAIFGGLSFLCKESFLFYLPFLAIGLWFSKESSPIIRIKTIFLFFFLFFIVWGIWPIRNYIQLGRLSFREGGGGAIAIKCNLVSFMAGMESIY